MLKATKKEELAHIKASIRASGLRVTAARLAVMRVMRRAARPLTHGDVVAELEGETWDRATLYRNLVDLAEAGLLHRVSLGSNWHFELGSIKGEKRIEHPHFVCTECGTVACARGVTLKLEAGRGSAKALRRGKVQVQFHGLCDNCG